MFQVKQEIDSELESMKCDSMESTSTNPPPKKRRLCKYNERWEIDRPWLRRASSISMTGAKCKVCGSKFSVGNKGLSAVKCHESSISHIKKSKDMASSKTVSNLSTPKHFPKENLVVAAELAHIFHAVKHNLSYKSLDCALKLINQTYSDSKLSQKISCGRTKAGAIVSNVLAPRELQMIVNKVKDKGLFFSIQTTSSNRKNRHFFPVCLQYFTVDGGIENKLIDFFESTDKTWDEMFASILKTLTHLRLDIKKVSGFRVENANGNFSRDHHLHNSLKSLNNYIIKTSCQSYIIHKCLKAALDVLSVDVENIVLKIYSHLSMAITEQEVFKGFRDTGYAELEEMLRHEKTSSFSLQPYIERLLKHWFVFKSYFFSLGSDCPKQISKVLLMNEYGIPETIEIYLLFCNHVLQLFQITIKQLEGNKLTVLDVYNIMADFRNNITSRLDQKFYGFETLKKILQIPAEEREVIENEFITFYKCALNYTSERFDFTDSNWLFTISCLSLKNNIFPEYKDFLKITDKLKLDEILEIDMNELCEEVTSVYDNFEVVSNHVKWSTFSNTAQKWQFILSIYSTYVNMCSIISYMLSLPSTAGFVEKIFSTVNLKWSDERNRCSADLIKNELIVCINNNMTCKEFFESIKDNDEFLNVAKNKEKYESKCGEFRKNTA